jgi:hypothetical protein
VIIFQLLIENAIKYTQHALAGDGSTGGEKSCRQSRFPRYAAAGVLYNGMAHGGG